MIGKRVRVALSILLLCGVASVLLVILPSLVGAASGGRDFISYWASGQQLAHHRNPYDGAAVLTLERSAGLAGTRPNLMLNTPTIFFLVWPLGFVGPNAGFVLWELAIVAALMGSVRMLWVLNGQQNKKLRLVAYFFAPILACLMAGQLGLFMLFGFVVFLYFYRTRPMIAGAALLLCAIKPHLFLPVGVVMVAWAIHSKTYRILTSAFAALLASSVLAFCLDANSWSEYAQMMRNTSEVQNEFIPTMSMILRLSLNRDAVWIQFLPTVVAGAWGLWYFFKHRGEWDWMNHGLLLLIVSELCAPHAWFTDEVILLPSVMTALYRTERPQSSLRIFGVLAAIALIETMVRVPITSVWYLWSAPAWFAWYLYAMRRKATSPIEARKDKRLNEAPIAHRG